jgi:integrase
MASLSQKGDIFIVRFRYADKEFKKSLKVRERSEAQNAKNSVEITLHRLLTGQIAVPQGIDPGDFIVSGGTLSERTSTKTKVPTVSDLITSYLKAQKAYLAESTHYLFQIHLNHWQRYLGTGVTRKADQVSVQELDVYLQRRIETTSHATAAKERRTLIHLFKWAVAQNCVTASPAAGLPVIREIQDPQEFRTVAEVEAIIQRGGLPKQESLSLWECVYLTPDEISNLLRLVQQKASQPESFLLHSIPAFTGMRRGEILRLLWLDVNIDKGSITARSRKQSRKKRETIRKIDIHPELQKILVERQAHKSKGQHVLSGLDLMPLTPHQANRLFWQPLRGTNWCLDPRKNHFKIGFHTYRHSFASNLAAAGVDQRIIDKFMGHCTPEMRLRYQHLFPKDCRSAIESLAVGIPSDVE